MLNVGNVTMRMSIRYIIPISRQLIRVYRLLINNNNNQLNSSD